MEELTTLPEYLKASNADGLAILEATAVWCSQCKAISPFVRDIFPCPIRSVHWLKCGMSRQGRQTHHQVSRRKVLQI